MASIRFPFQNNVLASLPKEKWKSIPGFDGLYKISNYGRIKSLSRRIPMNSPNGGEYVSKEIIRKARLDVKVNKTTLEPIYSLNIALCKGGIKYHFSVARLVYYVFGKKYDLANRSILISHKDHDGRNVDISNLQKSDMSTIKLNSYEEGRAVSHLKGLSKPVTQFDSKGNPLRTFPSMYEAGKNLGINSRAIASIASGNGHMYYKFFWKPGRHTRRLNLRKISRTHLRDTIHRSLLKRLKLKNIDANSPPPFLNLSTKSMKGEVWKDVPGYKGLYMISSFGRVKAMQKVTHGIQKKWMPEQIQKLTVDFRINSKGKEVPGSTFVCMAKNGKKNLVSVPRLVYYLFVERFNKSDSTVRIYYKDGNTLNLHYTNLILKNGAWSINRTLKTKTSI